MLRSSLTTLASLSSRMIFCIFRKLATLGPAQHSRSKMQPYMGSSAGGTWANRFVKDQGRMFIKH
jgi:hypothetical protein